MVAQIWELSLHVEKKRKSRCIRALASVAGGGYVWRVSQDAQRRFSGKGILGDKRHFCYCVCLDKEGGLAAEAGRDLLAWKAERINDG